MKRARTCALSLVAGCTLLLAPGLARGAEETVEHTIRAGDNLHLIAGYYYGDPRQWKRIWKLNRKALAGPNSLAPGKVLRVEVAPGQVWDVPYEDFLSRVRRK